MQNKNIHSQNPSNASRVLILEFHLDGKQAAVYLHGIFSYAIEEPQNYEPPS